MKRHGNERVGEHRLVKADGFVAVGQEHRATVTAFKEREGGEGLSPGEDVLEGFLEALFEPSLRLLVVELVGDGVGTLVEVVRQEFRERGKTSRSRIRCLAVYIVTVVILSGRRGKSWRTRGLEIVPPYCVPSRRPNG